MFVIQAIRGLSLIFLLTSILNFYGIDGVDLASRYLLKNGDNLTIDAILSIPPSDEPVQIVSLQWGLEDSSAVSLTCDFRSAITEKSEKEKLGSHPALHLLCEKNYTSSLTLTNVNFLNIGKGRYNLSRMYLTNDWKVFKFPNNFTGIYLYDSPKLFVNGSETGVPFADDVTNVNFQCRLPISFSINEVPSVTWGFLGDTLSVFSYSHRFTSSFYDLQTPISTLRQGKRVVCSIEIELDDTLVQLEVKSLPIEAAAVASIKSRNKEPLQPVGKLVLSCETSGYPKPSILWSCDFSNMTSSNPEYEIDLLHLKDPIRYSCNCTATNFAGGRSHSSVASKSFVLEDIPRELLDDAKVEWWLWLIVGLGCALFLAVVIVVVVTCLRRRVGKENEFDQPKIIDFREEDPPKEMPLSSLPPSYGDFSVNHSHMGPGVYPPSTGVYDHDAETRADLLYAALTVDNRPGSRRPIASPLETVEGSSLYHDMIYNA